MFFLKIDQEVIPSTRIKRVWVDGCAGEYALKIRHDSLHDVVIETPRAKELFSGLLTAMTKAEAATTGVHYHFPEPNNMWGTTTINVPAEPKYESLIVDVDKLMEELE